MRRPLRGSNRSHGFFGGYKPYVIGTLCLYAGMLYTESGVDLEQKLVELEKNHERIEQVDSVYTQKDIDFKTEFKYPNYVCE